MNLKYHLLYIFNNSVTCILRESIVQSKFSMLYLNMLNRAKFTSAKYKLLFVD